jgi:hypothetical protein
MADEAEDVPADEPAREGEGKFNDRAERVRAGGTGRIGAMNQAAAKLHGSLEGVDTVRAVVADVEDAAAVGTAGLLDVKDLAVKHRVFGPAETHDCPSWLLTLSLLSLFRWDCLV